MKHGQDPDKTSDDSVIALINTMSSSSTAAQEGKDIACPTRDLLPSAHAIELEQP